MQRKCLFLRPTGLQEVETRCLKVETVTCLQYADAQQFQSPGSTVTQGLWLELDVVELCLKVKLQYRNILPGQENLLSPPSTSTHTLHCPGFSEQE